MKSFDDFLSQLPENDFEKTIDEAISHTDSDLLTEKVKYSAYWSAMILLRKYHEWLNADQE